MKEFLLSQNYRFPFSLFGLQHIAVILLTLLCFVFIYFYKDKLSKLSERKLKGIRLLMAVIILLNMFIYRVSYIYYGVYQIKIHLSLYYCHIVNYLFVLSLIINYKPFYKIVYGLSWTGAIWTIFFPDLSGGIDCFIFYSSFISHNLLLVFTTFMLIINKEKYKTIDLIKSMFYAIAIILFTYFVNYDFGTRFNTPHSILKQYVNLGIINGYSILFIIGLIGNLFGLFVNKLFFRRNFMKKKNLLMLILFISCLSFIQNIRAEEYKCSYDFTINSTTSFTGAGTYSGYFEVDTTNKKILPEDGYFVLGQNLNVKIADAIFDPEYSDAKMVYMFDGHCPDQVYACRAKCLFNDCKSYFMLLLNGSLMDELPIGEYFSMNPEIPEAISHIIDGDEECGTGKYNGDDSTKPSKHFEFECGMFDTLKKEMDNNYCNLEEDEDCSVSQLETYNKAKDKLKSYCQKKVSYGSVIDPCVLDCINYSKSQPDLTPGEYCGFSYRLAKWIKNILKWGKYLVPIIVIVLGILDFIKAMSADKDDEMKKAQGRFVKRLIAAALIFIIPFIIEFVLDKMGFTEYINGCGIIDL